MSLLAVFVFSILLTSSAAIRCHCSLQNCSVGQLQGQCEGAHCIIGFQRFLDLPVLFCGQESIENDECTRSNGSLQTDLMALRLDPDRICRCKTELCNVMNLVETLFPAENDSLSTADQEDYRPQNSSVDTVTSEQSIPVWMYGLVLLLLLSVGLLTCLSLLLSYKLKQLKVASCADSSTATSEPFHNVYVTTSSHYSSPYGLRREVPASPRCPPSPYPVFFKEPFVNMTA
uniref:Activin_recp domain-containing protein n=1 Tax=Steinernema glaseri TaxID=37863 RepID=A0A1I8A6S4_9BILA